METFLPIANEIIALVEFWEPKLVALKNDVITNLRNNQNRSIRQIVGHMIDSASNNTHRIIHLQNLVGPLVYPNYASNGNNDRWIAIQNFQEEDWTILVQLWKYSNLHVAHVIKNLNAEKLQNQWIAGADRLITLEEMVVDYPRHLKLHLDEIEELISKV